MVDDEHAQVLFGGQGCQHLEESLALVLVQPGGRLIQGKRNFGFVASARATSTRRSRP